ncbi:hypothetical protein M758_8G129400 [Ceratodon purpureus]|uniref:Uncharacterized protein n=1 Tax=Ceratodon purpureus TaxID=3225 RepID=A0A8T0H6I6_CERPU|nr:hypothetical protein KC19_8G134000 [Ceratodon purpureus]KAG0608749.1 hypothetical protein M758_8G129400 [Ceratodon purpureus]
MLESEWSDPQSELTEELGFASRPAVASDPSRFYTAFAAPQQRCVVPKAQPSQLNRSDQRVPVYWDQTVPVWEDGRPSSSATKRKASASHGRELQGRCARQLEGGGASSSDTMSVENSGENCWCCSRGDYSTRRGDDGASTNSPEVSFDAILSMYESSLVEKSSKWSRRDWWVLGALLNPRSRSRGFKPRVHDQRGPRRRFAGGRRFPGGLNISVQFSASGALMEDTVVDHDEVESVRRLRVAIERTSIHDVEPPSAICHNSYCRSTRMRNANAILLERRRSCDFQNHRDPLSYATRMLTTSSS